MALDRLVDFPVKVFGQRLCPECWLWRDEQQVLREQVFLVGSSTRVLDCPKCNYHEKVAR
jgi:hypothetical protein